MSMPRAASGTTFNLTENNLGISESVGTITLIRSGDNVEVTITMRPGYKIITQGGFLGLDLSGGLKLTKTSLGHFSVTGLSDKLENSTTRGGFSFSQLFETMRGGSQLFVSTLRFTIQNATVGQIAGLGIHFCVVRNDDCSASGFAVTGTPTSAVPEPGTLGLLGTGLLGIAGLVRRRLR
jgi:PEP-CTERM motif